MIGDGKTFCQRHSLLTLLDLGIIKLFNTAAIETYQVVVVLALVKFIDCLVTLKMAADQNVGVFKLRQYPVNRGQADIRALLHQHSEYILGRHVPLAAGLENFQNFQSRQGGLEAGAFEFVNLGHAGFSVASVIAVLCVLG